MGQGVIAVDRALSIIKSFDRNDRSLPLQTLSDRTGLNKSTILRLIASLEKASFMIKRGPGEYALGPALLLYGGIYQSSLQLSEHVLPALNELVISTGQTAAFFVRDGESRICLHMVESYSVLRSHLRVGSVQPLIPSGSGRILLAFSPDPEEAARFPKERQKYYAVNKGERHPKISSIAAPVFGYDMSLVGAMSVSGPTSDYSKKNVRAFRDVLLHSAEKLTSTLGGSFRYVK